MDDCTTTTDDVEFNDLTKDIPDEDWISYTPTIMGANGDEWPHASSGDFYQYAKKGKTVFLRSNPAHVKEDNNETTN